MPNTLKHVDMADAYHCARVSAAPTPSASPAALSGIQRYKQGFPDMDEAEDGSWVLLSDVEDAFLASPACHDATGAWQPIATAPKDGTFVLLATPKGRIADGNYQQRYGVWSWPYVVVNPTHWMPLPPAPQAQHGGRES